MSVRINLHQKTRPYKIDIFGLQDNFIGSLHSYEDTFLGQVVEPLMEIKDDGTQVFSCKIPKFYLSEEPNTKIVNPRWQDIENGILAENTRILKVFIQFSEEQTKVYPFIIDKIVNKRDKNFSVYKEITCNGLAFAELGKQGYKVELNSFTLEQDFIKDDTTLATIDYWLDKVFPNEKDEEGFITKWLTPWCYEIRMDWSGYLEEISNTFINGGTSGQIEGYKFYNGNTFEYTDEDILKKWWQIDAGTSSALYQPRDETVIYEKPYISNWDVIDGKLSPISVVSFKEKARYIDCANSNKYNITQTIAKTFEVFCVYEYTCEPNGHFKKTYFDEAGNIWTGKKVIFFNRAIKTNNPYVVNYQNNLNSISRTVDSSELYTKMYVNPIASEAMDTGYVSIADTTLNPLLDDFILNFDYLYKIGSINDMQKAEIESYKIKLHKLNKKIIHNEEKGSDLSEQLNELESLRAQAKATMESAQEQLGIYEKQMQSLAAQPTIKNVSNACPITLVPKESMGIISGSLRLEGINAATIIGYSDTNYTKELFSFSNLIHAQNAPSDANINIDRWYITKDEFGYPETIFTSIKNTIFSDTDYFGNNFNPATGARIYLSLEYFPKNKYETICNSFQEKINIQRSKIEEYDTIIGKDEGNDEELWSGLKKEIRANEKEREFLYQEKEALNFKLERILGPALREGYWQPENYEDPGEGHNVVLSKDNRNEIIDNTSIIFDEELFDEEQKEYYYASSEDVDKDIRTYYPFIPLESICDLIGSKIDSFGAKRLVSDFSFVLFNPEYKWTTINNNTVKQGQEYYVLLDGKYYTFEIPDSNKTNEGLYPIGTDLIIYTVPTEESNNKAPYLKVDGVYTPMNYVANKPDIENIYNLTGAFMGSNQYLSTRHLYNISDFQYAYFKYEKDGITSIKPVALLTNENIDYTRYKVVKYSFDKGATIEDEKQLEIKKRNGEETYKLVYPRIFIDYRNVNVNSDSFKIYVTSDSKKINKFEDYQILKRRNRPYITLKVTDRQPPSYLLTEIYNIIFQISRANEQLYLDAQQVAKDSSKPKYSYEIQAANIPGEIDSLELGQLCHINDYSIDIYKEYGYISELKYQLDKPQNDSIVISNYKTKFEDLFSSISAQSEAMKQNKDFYNIALASFQPNGDMAPDVLQSTLNNNNFSFNFSDSNLQLDSTGGLVLTNLTPYSHNGVFGQLALRGGGIYCSGSINDKTGERNWETAITPSGINASTITTGKLNTRLINIMSGDETAFQWNNEGLFAYKNIGNNGIDKFDDTTYVKLNEDGLLYMSNGRRELELGWEGLKLETASGHFRLTSANGLQMLDDEENPLVTFGKYNNQYGMFFTNAEGKIQLQASQEGNLQLIDTLKIGNSEDDNYAGLCGTDNDKDPITGESIRIWAGSYIPTSAEFTVGENGAVKAKRIFIQNSDGSKFLELTYDKLDKLLKLI